MAAREEVGGGGGTVQLDVRFLALATDYDRTLAEYGQVEPSTVQALVRLRDSGRRAFLVTGRTVPDLKAVFSRLELFDAVVAENGALVHVPATDEIRELAPAPSPDLLERLRDAGIPIYTGSVIVGTRAEHRIALKAALHDWAGLPTVQVIPNKDSLMILPAGVDKATGLAALLKDYGLDPERVVAIGDAENDLVFLRSCGLGVAVANALPEVKLAAMYVTAAEAGAGVEEVIDGLLADDLESLRWPSALPEAH